MTDTLKNPPAFTKGPWVAREQRAMSGESLGWIVEHVNGRIGWSSYATAKPNEGERAPFPIGSANAHLIASAPDLYEALKLIVEDLREREDILVPETWKRMAEAALAKADGLSADPSRQEGQA